MLLKMVNSTTEDIARLPPESSRMVDLNSNANIYYDIKWYL